MSSRKTYKRKVSKEAKRMETLLNDSLPQNVEPGLLNTTTSSSSVIDDKNYSNVLETVDIEDIPLKKKLKNWFLKYNPSVKCTTSLLKILKTEQLDVPTSVTGLLGKTKKCTERTVYPGKYVHIGLQQQLKKISSEIISSGLDEIFLDIGIDGLPLFKSSGLGLWPILAQAKQLRNTDVFIIGCYVGAKKPINVNSFLHDFVNDVLEINKSGFFIDQKTINIKIRAFICDAPAKAFVCGIKGHMSSNGCSKCQQYAKKIDGVMRYSETVGDKRTDEDFSLRKYPNFHQPIHMELQMELERLGVGMVSKFPIDSMHLIDLGITKKILVYITKKKSINPVPSSSILLISEALLSLSPHIPREFARKPRTLLEICRWKATEFRQFSLYTGIVVLKENVPEEIYTHFLLLFCFYRIYSVSSNSEHKQKAETMVRMFVEQFPVLYGRSSVSYNVHNVLHIPECVEQFGILSNFSAYSFENFMQKIKKKIKMPKHISQQIYNNFVNEPILLPSQHQGLKYQRGDIKSISVLTGYFSNQTPDNICLLKNGVYVKIIKILSEEIFMGKTFKNPQNFFNYPINSMDINICFVEAIYFEEDIFKFDSIRSKIVKLPYNNGFVLIPEIHSCC